MIETLLIATLSVVVTQAGLLWYKLGKVEGKVEELCRRLNVLNGEKGGK